MTEPRSQTIAVTGASGLVGRSVCRALTGAGHRVLRLVRRKPTGDDEVLCDAMAGRIDTAALAAVDGIVHLAGENIAEGRWNAAKKQRIRSSRVDFTRSLCEAIAGLDSRTRTLVSASAIGWYGDRDELPLDETADPGEGFLPEVCSAWEAATEPAAAAGVRVVNLRIGVVLSPDGGALAKMLTPFRLGGGGVIGSGRQEMSWIALDDLVGVICHALDCDELSGPVNAVSPHPVTNREFTKTLGRVLRRPTILPMPAFAARLAFGEMADALLLSSSRVVPARLQQTGYEYQYPDLEPALRHLLGR